MPRLAVLAQLAAGRSPVHLNTGTTDEYTTDDDDASSQHGWPASGANDNDLPVGALDFPPSLEELRDATMARVVKQVHFYFGDRNYPTDKFLRKNARRHPEAFIPLSVVAIYKKMKKITDDVELMAEALEGSDVVELSADRSSIRRRLPPPKNDPEAVCSAMVVVDGYRGDAMGLARLLAPAGHIVRTHHVRPNTSLPSEIFEVFRDRPLPGSLGARQAECWLVEFDYADEALQASRELPAQQGCVVGCGSGEGDACHDTLGGGEGLRKKKSSHQRCQGRELGWKRRARTVLLAGNSHVNALFVSNHQLTVLSPFTLSFILFSISFP